MRFQLRLNEPSTGSMELPRDTEEAKLISVAKLIRVQYRGRFRGAWFVENISDTEVSNQEGEEYITVRGRGGLSILDEAVVWYDQQGETKRVFTNQPICAQLKTMVEEAQTRGCFPNVNLSFTDTEDSEGNTWNDSRTLEWRVGTSLLDVARKVAGLGIDFEVDYEWEIGEYTLHAYQDGLGEDRSVTVNFRAGHNCREVTSEQAGEELRNVYLLEYGQGQFSSVEDTTSISIYRRKEKSLSVGQAGSATEADEYGQQELDEAKNPKQFIRIEVEDYVEPMVFVNYGMGDWVGYYNREGEYNKYRIRGIILDWGDDRRYAKVRLELSSIRQELEIRNAKSVSKLGGGLASDRSQPDDTVSAINTHNNDPNAHPNRDEFVELQDTPGAYTGEGRKFVRVKNTEDGLEFFLIPKSNYASAVDPAVDDDEDDGYSIGSHWVNTSTDTIYVCVDPTAGSAIWIEVSGSGGGGATTFLGLSDTPSVFTDHAFKTLRVNSAETAVEFALKQNRSATTAPTVNNDSSEGYEVGSRWFDVTNDKEYVCLDATSGAAVWVETTATASGTTDTDAIHDNVGSEIQAITEKVNPADADLAIIEDSEDSYNKKKVQLSNLPGGGGGGGLSASDADVSTPPTSSSLTGALGDPTTLGDGYAAILDDAGAGEDVYFVAVQNSKWWVRRFDKPIEDPGYSDYKTITVNGSLVAGDLTNFIVPVVISSDNDLRTTANGGIIENTTTGGAGGGKTVPADMTFALDQYGAVEIPFEVSRYDPATGELIAYVRVPDLPSTGTTVYLCFGNSSITTSQEDLSQTWVEYYGVWHLEETTGDYFDSSGNGNHMTPYNSPTRGVTGVIGNAVTFDGVDQYLQYAGDALNGERYPWTITGLFKAVDHTVSQVMLSLCTGHNYNYKSFQLQTQVLQNNRSGGGSNIVRATTDATSGAWHSGAASAEKNVGMWIYMDGGYKNSGNEFNQSDNTNTDIGRLGRPSDAAYFEGTLDEHRIAKLKRSDAFVETEHNSLMDNANFVTVGATKAMSVFHSGSQDIYQAVFSTLFAYSTAETHVLDTETVIPIEAVDIIDTGSFEVADDGTSITFLKDGIYSIDYSASAEVRADVRSKVFWELQIDRGSGYATMNGTKRFTYHRTSGDGYDSASGKVALEISANDKIRLVGNGDEPNNLYTEPHGVSIYIEERL